jgi:hypothetical protein
MPIMGNILTKREIQEMFTRAKVYRAKVPVMAVQAKQRCSVENVNGSIEVAHPGDYIVTSAVGNLPPGVLKKEYFEDSFEVLKEEDAKAILKARTKR